MDQVNVAEPKPVAEAALAKAKAKAAPEVTSPSWRSSTMVRLRVLFGIAWIAFIM